MKASSGSVETSIPFSIAVENLSKRFNREWIFRDFSHEFRSGTTHAIVGPNGSGKSTMLQILWGQVPPTSGSVQYRNGTSEISHDYLHRHISIATPYMDLIEEFTLREMLDFHFRLKRLRPGVTLTQLAERMYLDDALNKQLVNFSSGMRQRLKLALAFYTTAEAYFLDEPGTNLDTKAFDWYRRELATLPENSLVIIASNNAEEYPKGTPEINVSGLRHRGGPA